MGLHDGGVAVVDKGMLAVGVDAGAGGGERHFEKVGVEWIGWMNGRVCGEKRGRWRGI